LRTVGWLLVPSGSPMIARTTITFCTVTGTLM
jgi:hypothetical protein